MGWGESHGPSAEMVRRNEERACADALAAAVGAFLRDDTTSRERLARALDNYLKVRHQ